MAHVSLFRTNHKPTLCNEKMQRINLIIILTVISLFTKGQTKIQFTEIRPPYKSISPAVKNLLHESNNPGFNASGFWDTIKTNKLPIVETDPLYTGYVWVTRKHGFGRKP
jgi:hypothetical protein